MLNPWPYFQLQRASSYSRTASLSVETPILAGMTLPTCPAQGWLSSCLSCRCKSHLRGTLSEGGLTPLGWQFGVLLPKWWEESFFNSNLRFTVRIMVCLWEPNPLGAATAQSEKQFTAGFNYLHRKINRRQFVPAQQAAGSLWVEVSALLSSSDTLVPLTQAIRVESCSHSLYPW